MKKIICNVMFLFMLVFINTICVKAGTIYVNNSRINVESIMVDYRTLVPIRGVFEKLGFEVNWDNTNRTAELYNKYSKEKIVIKANEESFLVNDEEIRPDVPQMIIDGSLYIPLRAVSEAIDADVVWDGEKEKIYITRDEKVVFNDEGIETLVRDELNYESGEDISVNDLKRVFVIDVESAEGIEIKSIEDLNMFDNIIMINLKNQDIDDLSPLMENELVDYYKINISGIENANLSDIEGLNVRILIVDDSQTGDLRNISSEQMIIENSGKDLSVDLNGLLENVSGLNDIDMSDVKISDTNDLKLLSDFEKVILPYDVGYYGNDDFDSFITKYISFLSEVEKEIENIKKSGSSEYERIKEANDYIVNNTDYDIGAYYANNIPREDYTAFGVIYNKKGVCQGYAEAFKLFMDEIGIECMIISGEANGIGGWGGHAWNIVKIKDKYYHIDVTFDDPVVDGEPVLRYDYFLISDSQMSIDHNWDKKEYPECVRNY